MNYLKKAHMVCLSGMELETMFKEDKQREIVTAMEAGELSLEEIKDNPTKMQEIVDVVHKDFINNKEDIEIFVAVFGHLAMYPADSQVCIVLNDSADPRKTPIKNLRDLKSFTKEGSITDFGILSEDGLRQFQLKQYRENLNTNELFKFIEKKVNKYGGDLGNTNLLVVIQSESGDMGDIDFEDLNKRICGIGIKSDCEILISYNEDNKFDVINVVYPSLATKRLPRKTFS